MALLVVRRADALTNPQFWAEDATIFFKTAFEQPTLASLLAPYAGYLHLVPRCVALICGRLFEPETIPFDPDFNRKSLRGNIVLRWEYVRGSTLFFVWNMSTLDLARPGVFTPRRDLGSVFGADGTHVFMLKMTYWFGL